MAISRYLIRLAAFVAISVLAATTSLATAGAQTATDISAPELLGVSTEWETGTTFYRFGDMHFVAEPVEFHPDDYVALEFEIVEQHPGIGDWLDPYFISNDSDPDNPGIDIVMSSTYANALGVFRLSAIAIQDDAGNINRYQSDGTQQTYIAAFDEVTVGPSTIPVFPEIEFTLAERYCGGQLPTVVLPYDTPTNGDDIIVGTDGDDWIEGLGGNDVICGLGGDDYIDGGTGADVIRGGSGPDWLLGGAGNDRLLGGPGADVIEGESGADRIVGSKGADWLDGGQGKDKILGGLGNDTIVGGDGNDRLGGGAGGDILDGGLGRDRIFGGAGGDEIYAGLDDRIDGGAGVDVAEIDGFDYATCVAVENGC